MNSFKYISLYIGTSSALGISAMLFFTHPLPIPDFLHDNFHRIIVADAKYVGDFSDDKVLMGASHNVFIGKVLREMGTKDFGIGPETQFEVEVIENIKGDLQGSITLDQLGGYKEGVLYIFGDSQEGLVKGEDYLLRPGLTYLFSTRYNENEDWYTLNSYPTARKVISEDDKLNKEQLVALTINDIRINELRAAYPNEVLIQADVNRGKAFNSYNSLEKPID